MIFNWNLGCNDILFFICRKLVFDESLNILSFERLVINFIEKIFLNLLFESDKYWRELRLLIRDGFILLNLFEEILRILSLVKLLKYWGSWLIILFWFKLSFCKFFNW